MNRSSSYISALLVVIILSTCWVTPAHASSLLRGRVIDPEENPVVGALVEATLSGTTIRAITNDHGLFSMQLPTISQDGTLSVVAAGFRTTDMALETDDADLEITLSPSQLFQGEVVVTKNRATVGETPVTVTNVTREDIERNNWGQDVPLLLQKVPSFYAYNDNGQGMGYSYFFLRGFDMRRTSVSLNGVPLNDAESHAVYFVDLADFLNTTGDIQVQRGVGTNLYGGSAIGGAVDLRTRTPRTEPRLRVALAGGSWGTQRFNVEFDSGIIDDTWATTVRYSRVESDGYRQLSWLEAWNYYATVEHFGRSNTTRLVLFGGPETTHLAYEGITKKYLDGEVTGDKRHDRRYNPLAYPGEIDTFTQPHFQLLNSWQASPTVTVDNTLYYFEGDGYYEQYKSDRWMPEYDLEPWPGPGGEIIDSTDLIRRREVDEWDAGWVPTVTWTHAEDRGTLQSGLALRLHKAHHSGRTVWAEYYPPGTPPNQPYYDYRVDKQTLQPFAQESWRLSSKWSLSGGLTWTWHQYEMHSDQRNDVEFTETFDYLLPRLGVTLKPNDSWWLYANVSKGGREPAFRDIYDPQDYWFGDQPNELEPEDLADFELGAQHTWATGYAQMNFFYLDFDNAIVWAGGLDSDGLPITANGAQTTNRGVELEMAWTPKPRLGGRLTASYNHAVFDNFVEHGWDGNEIDYSGNRIAGVPEMMAALELTGGWGPVDLLVTGRYVGQFYLDNTEDMRKDPGVREDPAYIHRVNDAFTTVGIAVKLSVGPHTAGLVGAKAATLDLRVNNVLDRLYTTFGYVWGPEPTWIPSATRSAYLGLTVDW